MQQNKKPLLSKSTLKLYFTSIIILSMISISWSKPPTLIRDVMKDDKTAIDHILAEIKKDEAYINKITVFRGTKRKKDMCTMKDIESYVTYFGPLEDYYLNNAVYEYKLKPLHQNQKIITFSPKPESINLVPPKKNPSIREGIIHAVNLYGEGEIILNAQGRINSCKGNLIKDEKVFALNKCDVMRKYEIHQGTARLKKIEVITRGILSGTNIDIVMEFP